MARLDKTVRAAVEQVIPPRQCGRPTRDGTPCERYVNVGASVCYTHGGNAKQVKAKAIERVTLAEALVRGDKRHAWEVLEDGLHISDVLMREVVLDIQELGNQVPAETMDKLVSVVERAHRLAKTNLDAGIDQRRMRLAEAQATQMQAFVTRVLSGLHLTAEQKAMVPELIRREVRGITEQKVIEAAA